MREIKFRQALYRNGKFYKFRYWGFGLIDEPKEKFFMPEISVWEGGDGSIDCKQKPEESMQFTGLHDKNGKEIFEGDVIMVLDRDWMSCHGCHKDPQSHMKDIAFKWPVVFKDDSFVIQNPKNEHDYVSLWKEYGRDLFEIIGNIYETPTLLKSEE